MENMRLIRYVRPVQNAITRVMAIARGALREGYKNKKKLDRDLSWRVRPDETHIWHLFGNVGDSVKAAKTVQRVHQSGDETYCLVLPAGVINPGFEYKLSASIGWRTGDNRNQHCQPANLFQLTMSTMEITQEIMV